MGVGTSVKYRGVELVADVDGGGGTCVVAGIVAETEHETCFCKSLLA